MILSVETQSDIRRLHDIFVARMAFEYRCEQPDVLAAIQPQPDPKQAAPSAATALGADTGGEEPSILPATPLPETADETAGGFPVAAAPVKAEQQGVKLVTRETSAETSPRTDVTGGESAATTSPEPQPTSTPAVQAQNVEPSSKVLDGPSPSPLGAERAADPAPSLPARGRPETTRAQVVAVHHAHPEWPSKLIAEHLGISEDAVRATASRKKLKLVSWWDYQRAEATKKAAALIAPAQPETPPVVSAEPAIGAPAPAKAKKPTLGDRIVAVRAEHPDWPYRVVAKHLGAPKNSVQAYASVLGFTWPSQAEYDAAQAAAAEPVVEPPKRETITDRLRAYVVEHPDATLREVSDALGVKQTSVGYAANNAGIVLRKYTAEERSAATSRGIQAKIAEKAPAQPVEGADMARPGKVALDTENEPLDAPRVIKRPKGQRVRLRQKLGAGKYLHMGGEGLVDSKVYAWIGTPSQLEALRAKFPDTAGMVEEVVEP